jgi:hypothetical protein
MELGQVGTLAGKNCVFRVLRDEDFQVILGLASDVHRMRNGIRFVISAARVVKTHKDEQSVQLLIDLVSALGESPVLPEHSGHDRFEITTEEAESNSEEEAVGEIPRPAL